MDQNDQYAVPDFGLVAREIQKCAHLPAVTQSVAILDALNDIKTGIQGLSHRVDGLSNRVDELNHRVDGLSQRIDRIDHRLDRIDQRLDSQYSFPSLGLFFLSL